MNALTPDDFTLSESPEALFDAWMAEAEASEPRDPNAIALATVDRDGRPDVRTVLLKGKDPRGFVFYTNAESAKGEELAAHAEAAFVLYWKSLNRQIRVRGTATREDGSVADDYYRGRPVDSRLGAWASAQSNPLETRQVLMDKLARMRNTLGEDPARPPFWGGFRIVPQEIEFWADGPNRLHDRFRWTRPAPGQGDWTVRRLSP